MTKRDRELLFFERFCALTPDLSPGEVEHSDSPDFIFLRGEYRIGLEVTVFSPEPGPGEAPYEEQRSLQQRIVAAARRRYEEAGGLPLQVQVIFVDRHRLSKARVSELAQALAEHLLRVTPGTKPWDEVRFNPMLTYQSMPEVGHLGTHRVPEYDYGVWYPSMGGWVRHATVDDFKKVLALKEPKVDSYRAKCDQAWLLVVFETLGGLTHVEGPERPLAFTVNTSFDRVFSLDNHLGRCIEIPKG